MVKKLALLLSIFFIFDRFMYYKIEHDVALHKLALQKEQESSDKRQKPNKRLFAQVGQGCTATGRKMFKFFKS